MEGESASEKAALPLRWVLYAGDPARSGSSTLISSIGHFRNNLAADEANMVSVATVCSVPVDYVKLPVRDLKASRMFYEAALAPFGYRLVYDGETSLGFGVGDGGDEDEPFAVERGEAQGMPSHIAFTAASIEQVDAFHTAALSAGGEENGAPGERPYGDYYYAAFVLDPDGHNIEAVYHGER